MVKKEELIKLVKKLLKEKKQKKKTKRKIKRKPRRKRRPRVKTKIIRTAPNIPRPLTSNIMNKDVKNPQTKDLIFNTGSNIRGEIESNLLKKDVRRLEDDLKQLQQQRQEQRQQQHQVINLNPRITTNEEGQRVLEIPRERVQREVELFELDEKEEEESEEEEDEEEEEEEFIELPKLTKSTINRASQALLRNINNNYNLDVEIDEMIDVFDGYVNAKSEIKEVIIDRMRRIGKLSERR